MARTSRKNHVPDQIIPEISDTEIFRTAIYLRLSLEDNGKKDGDSMENQQKNAAGLCRFPTVSHAGGYLYG